MGICLNPSNQLFRETVRNEIYVDKSLLIQQIEYLRHKVNKYICVTRPECFGKSTDANMLVAFYSGGCDSHDLFDSLKISQTAMYEEQLNKHHVIYMPMQSFLSDAHSVDEMIELFTARIMSELKMKYRIAFFDERDLPLSLEDIYAKTGARFVFIIDEWDCVYRDGEQDKEEGKKYSDYLTRLLKDKPYVEFVYMTGIPPIKKYGTHGCLNMFNEITMIHAGSLSAYMGFTDDEVKELCKRYSVDYSLMKEWYGGYRLNADCSVFSSGSVVHALSNRKFAYDWISKETCEVLRKYMKIDGLKDSMVQLLAGKSVPVNTTAFQNDMTTFRSKDDVLTLLIHLGYLGYNSDDHTCYIPNKAALLKNRSLLEVKKGM